MSLMIFVLIVVGCLALIGFFYATSQLFTNNKKHHHHKKPQDNCSTMSCSGNGYCVDGLCYCNPGFTGTDCSLPGPGPVAKCPGKTPCSGNGTCSNGICTCTGGYTGNDCSVAPGGTCPGTPVCTGHGTCLNGICTCTGGYTGTDCSVAPGGTCPGTPVCTGHGTCLNGICTCTGGYTGTDCAVAPGSCTATTPKSAMSIPCMGTQYLVPAFQKYMGTKFSADVSGWAKDVQSGKICSSTSEWSNCSLPSMQRPDMQSFRIYMNLLNAAYYPLDGCLINYYVKGYQDGSDDVQLKTGDPVQFLVDTAEGFWFAVGGLKDDSDDAAPGNNEAKNLANWYTFMNTTVGAGGSNNIPGTKTKWIDYLNAPNNSLRSDYTDSQGNKRDISSQFGGKATLQFDFTKPAFFNIKLAMSSLLSATNDKWCKTFCSVTPENLFDEFDSSSKSFPNVDTYHTLRKAVRSATNFLNLVPDLLPIMGSPFKSNSCSGIKTIGDLIAAGSKCGDNAQVGQQLRDSAKNIPLLGNQYSETTYQSLRALSFFGLFADLDKTCSFSKKLDLQCDVTKHGITSFLGALHDACVWVGNNQKGSKKDLNDVMKASTEAYQNFITLYGSKDNNLSQIIANLCTALGTEVAAQCPAVVPCTGKKGGSCMNSVKFQMNSNSSGYFQLDKINRKKIFDY